MLQFYDHEGKVATYDAPDGEGDVIGYTYEHLGFVPLEIYEDPSFDAEAAVREVRGCLPDVEEGCTDVPPSARPADDGS